ncbi:uncharacterized protein LOC133895935 isoform X1 [Phragmites australis]|uniref:uncharacterized protein LOC133895935 isoform X1 n=1 Tax=Phragmites australis TaxID=29695 RepID=UPI002D777FE8|nr:uncharacterized protein LOC133895935 isoform X1 [Phragmites australis]
MKKAKVVLAQPATGAPWLPLSSAPGPIRGGGEEAAYRANLRYRGLLHDYQELLKETEARKRRLHLDRLKKQMLLAEVKFLRKRFKSLSENQWQTIVCRVRNPAMPLATRTTAWAEHPSVHAVGSSSKSQPVQPRQDGPPRASPVIDLNEACEQSYEMEVEDNHGYREPLSIGKAKIYPMEDDAGAGPSDVRMPAFWDVRNPVGRAGKRKIAWQDQLALRV